MKPSFDEWFTRKYGCSFEELHMRPGMTYDNALRALMEAVREYVTEMVRLT